MLLVVVGVCSCAFESTRLQTWLWGGRFSFDTEAGAVAHVLKTTGHKLRVSSFDIMSYSCVINFISFHIISYNFIISFNVTTVTKTTGHKPEPRDPKQSQAAKPKDRKRKSRAKGAKKTARAAVAKAESTAEVDDKKRQSKRKGGSSSNSIEKGGGTEEAAAKRQKKKEKEEAAAATAKSSSSSKEKGMAEWAAAAETAEADGELRVTVRSSGRPLKALATFNTLRLALGPSIRLRVAVAPEELEASYRL